MAAVLYNMEEGEGWRGEVWDACPGAVVEVEARHSSQYAWM